MFSLLVINGFIFGTNLSFSAEVNIPMDLVNWQAKDGEFECRLEHQLPNNMGKFYFHAEPNSPLAAVLNLPNKPIQQAELFQLTAPWHSPAQHSMVDRAAKTTKGFAIFDVGIEPLLAAVSKGAWLRVSAMSDVQTHSDAYVLPSTSIESAFVDFNACRVALPEMSYQQARDMVLNFEFGQRVVSSEQRRTLASLVSYLNADQSVSRVLVDGHTDNVGSTTSNLQMSRVRADDVASTLMELGAPKSLIEVRAHGARYPVSTNATEFGQAKNRRVTVRVVRHDSSQSASSMDKKTEVQ
ncbi:OmpA family protein [Vibrio sp. 10N]|nr:OmpA family protein [Vibrio sp. 10N]